MIVIDELKEAVNIMLHPGTATQKERSIPAAVAFYYKVLVVPFILYIILALAIPEPTVSSSFIPSPFFTTILMLILTPFTVVTGVLASLIVLPLGLLVVAFLCHIIGKLLKVFNNPYSYTFTATVYSMVPYLLLVWLLVFTNIVNPMLIVGIAIIFFILAIWEIIILIIAFANQQKTSKLRAFAVWLVTGIVIAIIYLALVGGAVLAR